MGRQEQIAEVRARLAASRLVTLVGPGGIGKTRLALELLRDLSNAGQVTAWVDLAPLRSEQLVTQTVATSLGIREQPGRPLIETLIETIDSKPALLVMDNCEHVLQACIELIDALLQRCSSLRVLGTSREPLHILGEVTWRVPTLQVPERNQEYAVDELAGYPVVQLFIERAQAVQSDFALTRSNAQAVARICARLDGLPLAIELAAVQTRALSADQIIERLDDMFGVLVDGNRGGPTRQQTLRACLDWSFHLLSRPEQRLFERLAVFAGGFDLDAAEAIGPTESIRTASILGLLTRLLDSSLVQAQSQGAAMRYRLLEPVREYALDRLRRAGDESRVLLRHACHFTDLVEQAESELTGSVQIDWLNRLERDHDNVRQALRWAIDSGHSEMGLRIAAAMARFWSTRGLLAEGTSWFERVLAKGQGPAESTSVRAKALLAAGGLAWHQNELAHATALFEESVRAAEDLGDERLIAVCLGFQGLVAQDQRQFAQAVALFEESIALLRRLGDRRGTGIAVHNLACTWLLQGQWKQARPGLEQALSLFRELGDVASIADALLPLGYVARHLDDIERATSYFAESLREAERLVDRQLIVRGLEGLAGIACCKREFERAARLFGAAEAIHSSTDAALPAAERIDYDEDMRCITNALDSHIFDACWREGQSRPVGEMIDYALVADKEPVVLVAPARQHSGD